MDSISYRLGRVESALLRHSNDLMDSMEKVEAIKVTNSNLNNLSLVYDVYRTVYKITKEFEDEFKKRIVELEDILKRDNKNSGSL